MSCEQLTGSFPEFWDGTLPLEERRALEAHFASCEECRREAQDLREAWQAMDALPDEEPSPMLRQRVEAMLEGWQVRDLPVTPMPTRIRATATTGAAERPRWWQSPFVWSSGALVAASLLVAFGFLLGRDTSRSSSAAAAHEEAAALRTELRDMRQMVAISLLHQESVTERLRGVSWSTQLETPNTEVVDTLLDTLKNDQNVNVRLAAIDVLRQFAQSTSDQQNRPLRAALVQSISAQPSPLVQIALIDTMVQLREHNAVTVLRTLADDTTVNKAVRQRATWGVRQLTQLS
jgi:HEAT repeats/Putative zinc-finger